MIHTEFSTKVFREEDLNYLENKTGNQQLQTYLTSTV